MNIAIARTDSIRNTGFLAVIGQLLATPVIGSIAVAAKIPSLRLPCLFANRGSLTVARSLTNYVLHNTSRFVISVKSFKREMLLKTQETRLKRKGENGQMSAKTQETDITKILTDSRISSIKAMIEKDHAIDCLFLLLMNKGRWKEAKAFMNQHKLTLSDGTFRARMIEIEHLGLAKSTPIDPLKKYYTITDEGRKIAGSLLQIMKQI